MRRSGGWIRLCSVPIVAACTAGPADKGTDTDIGPDPDGPSPPAIAFVDDQPTTVSDLEVELLAPGVGVAYAWSWTVDGADAAVSDPTVPAARTSKSQVWTVTVAGTLDGRTGPASSLSVAVLNTPPVGALSLGPLAPTTLDALIASVVSTDPDGDEVSYTWSWRVDGRNTLVDTDTVEASLTSRDEAWEVTAIPWDGEAEGDTLRAQVAVANSAPRLDALIVSPDPAFETDTLTLLTDAVDDDDDPQIWTRAWFVDGTGVGGDETLTGELFSKGDVVYATASLSDGSLATPELQSPSVTIANSPPVLVGGAVSASETTESGSVTCGATGTSDADGDTVTLTTGWTVDGQPVAVGGEITGAVFDKHQTLVCTLITFDGEDAGQSWVSPPIPVRNTPPALDAVTLSPLDPSAEDQVVATPVGLTDADGDAIILDHAWFVDGALVSTGEHLESELFLPGSTLYVIVTPSDGESTGVPVQSGTLVAANTAPEVLSVSITPADPRTTDDLVAEVDAVDPDGTAVGLTFAWRVDGVAVATGPIDTLPASLTTRGQAVDVLVTPDDGFSEGPSLLSDPVEILNTPPVVAAVELGPTPLRTGVDATCTAVGWDDPDGDPESVLYLWTVDGVDQGAVPGNHLASSAFVRGQAVRCAAWPIDPFTPGVVRWSDERFVVNSPPRLESVSIDVAEPTEASVVSPSVGEWVDDDGDAVALDAVWTVDGVEVSTEWEITGAVFDKGAELVVRVTPRDLFEAGDTVVSAPVTVINTPPVLSGVSLSPASPLTTDPLVAAWTVVDPDPADDPGVTVAFEALGVPLQVGPAATLPAGLTSRGYAISVVVSVDDGEASAAEGAGPVVVGNTPPSLTAVAIDPPVLTEASVATCVPGSWLDPDGDPPSYRFRWVVQGAEVGTTDVLTGADFDAGDTVRCLAVPTDGIEDGAEVASSVVSVDNTPPVVAGVEIQAADPTEADTLEVAVGLVEDADGDSVELQFIWQVDGADVLAADSLTGAWFDKGDVVTVKVTPRDPSGEGAAVISDPVVIHNAPPVVLSVTLSPDPALSSDDLAMQVEWEDIDGDPVVLTRAWSRNGSVLPSQTGETLSEVWLGRSDVFLAAVTPHDGEEAGATAESAPLTISNSPPDYLSIRLSELAAWEATVLTCEAWGPHDVDGDLVVPEVTWFVDGAVVATTPTLDGSLFDRGEEVWCEAVAFDGIDRGPSQASPSLVVRNTAPTLASAALNLTQPTVADVLSVTAFGASDADGDPIEIDTSWRLNGVEVSGADVLPLGGLERGDTLWAVLTPHDDADAGIPVTSDLATIRNARPSLDAPPVYTPSPPRVGAPLVASASASDADGDTVTFTYQWWLNDSMVLTSGDPLLPAPMLIAGDTVELVVIPDDGLLPGLSGSSGEAIVLQGVPSAPGIALTPQFPDALLDDLVCEVSTASVDPEGDPITYVFSWTVDGVPWTGPQGDTSSTSTIAGSETLADDVWACTVTPWDTEPGSAATAQVTVLVPQIRSCTAVMAVSGAVDGIYPIDPQTDGGFQVDCDQNTEGGGWHAVTRTSGHALDVGQRTPALVTAYDTVDADEGVFEAFGELRTFSEVLLKAETGGQAGDHAVYELVEPTGDRSLLELLEVCRDEPVAWADDGAFAGARVVGHTSAWSGLRTSGDLRVYSSATESLPADYFFVCGVSESSDKDLSYLTFADAPGDTNSWGDDWRTSSQVGALWSFASGDYCCAFTGHIGQSTMFGAAGWKGESRPWEAAHTGTYSVWVR